MASFANAMNGCGQTPAITVNKTHTHNATSVPVRSLKVCPAAGYAYIALMTDTYPPFRLDQGPADPGGVAPTPSNPRHAGHDRSRLADRGASS